MGHAFRSIIDVVLKDIKQNNTIMWSKTRREKRRSSKKATERTDEPRQYNFPSIGGLSIDQLHPTPTKQKELLGPMLLTLTKEEFHHKCNLVSDTFGLSNSDANGQDKNNIDEGAIELDKSLGVFQL